MVLSTCNRNRVHAGASAASLSSHLLFPAIWGRGFAARQLPLWFGVELRTLPPVPRKCEIVPGKAADVLMQRLDAPGHEGCDMIEAACRSAR